MMIQIIILVQHRKYQRKSEEIFNYFNDLRVNPQNYLTEGQKHGLQKIISTAAEKAVEGNINNLIKNPYYDLLFDKCVKEYQRKQEEIRRKQNEELKRIEEMNKEIQKREEIVNKMCKENKIEVERLNRAIKAGKVMAIGGGIGCGVGVASLFAGGLLALSCPALTIPYLFYIGFACIPSGIALVGSGAVVSTVSGIKIRRN